MVTILFMIICTLVFGYIHLIAKDDSMSTLIKLGAMYPKRVRENKEYWRFLTCHFIHADFLHFFMNMYCIFYLGRFFENLLGSLLYVGLLISSMLISSLISYIAPLYFPDSDYTVTIGASGVFYGYLGAMIGLAVVLGGVFQQLLTANMSIIIINIGFTLLSPRVSKTGHLGGLLGGYMYIYILYLIHFIG